MALCLEDTKALTLQTYTLITPTLQKGPEFLSIILDHVLKI